MGDWTIPFTALLDPSLDKAVMQKEIFGPLLPVLKVASVEKAIEMVNDADRRNPLIAYCYSEDANATDTFCKRISAGTIAVNAGPMRVHANFNCGFGGIGSSGTGVHMWGKEAL